MISLQLGQRHGAEIRSTDAQSRLLRAETAANPAKIKDLIRRQSDSIKEFVSRKAKERPSRNFVKAYAYRLYTSAWVTPLITVGVLTLRSRYHLSIAETAYAQSLVEFVVKPFTYAAFEWSSAHVKWGYVNNGSHPEKLAEVEPKKMLPGSGAAL